MRLTRKVREILCWYESESPGTKANLARVLMTGRLGGGGKANYARRCDHGAARRTISRRAD